MNPEDAAIADAQRLQVAPTKQSVLRPLGCTVEREPLPEERTLYCISFLLSPFEVVSVELSEETKDALVRELTGVAVVRP